MALRGVARFAGAGAAAHVAVAAERLLLRRLRKVGTAARVVARSDVTGRAFAATAGSDVKAALALPRACDSA